MPKCNITSSGIKIIIVFLLQYTLQFFGLLLVTCFPSVLPNLTILLNSFFLYLMYIIKIINKTKPV